MPYNCNLQTQSKLMDGVNGQHLKKQMYGSWYRYFYNHTTYERYECELHNSRACAAQWLTAAYHKLAYI